MKPEKEPITISKVIVANNQKQTEKIAIYEGSLFTNIDDTYYVSECGSVTVSSSFIEDGGQPSAPSGMMMREAHHVN